MTNKIERFGIQAYDIHNPDDVCDRLIDIAEKMNEIIDALNKIAESLDGPYDRVFEKKYE